MVNDAGDRFFGHGDSTTAPVSGAVDAGDWVTYNSSGELVLVGNGDALAGVAYDDYDGDEDSATVSHRGVIHAKVDSGVTAGDNLGPHDGTGTDGVPVAGGSSGCIALEDAADDGSGTFYAKVLLR